MRNLFGYSSMLGLMARATDEAQVEAVMEVYSDVTRIQAEFMRARYCTELQGFLFSRPLPAEELPGMVARIQPGSELRAA